LRVVLIPHKHNRLPTDLRCSEDSRKTIQSTDAQTHRVRDESRGHQLTTTRRLQREILGFDEASSVQDHFVKLLELMNAKLKYLKTVKLNVF